MIQTRFGNFFASAAFLILAISGGDSATGQQPPITVAQARLPNLPPAMPGDNPKAREEAQKKAEQEAKRQAGRARLEALIAGRSGTLLIRRADTPNIERVYSNDSTPAIS